jgi:hypothetical protein
MSILIAFHLSLLCLLVALKGKKTLEKGKHQARSGRSDCESNITEVDKGKKRSAQSSNFDPPNKKSKKEGCQFPSTGKKMHWWSKG